MKLSNEKIIVEYDERDITVYQLHDINETTAYTTSKRNLNKCWDEIKKIFSDTTEFNTITNLFGKYNIKYRRYCGF